MSTPCVKDNPVDERLLPHELSERMPPSETEEIEIYAKPVKKIARCSLEIPSYHSILDYLQLSDEKTGSPPFFSGIRSSDSVGCKYFPGA